MFRAVFLGDVDVVTRLLAHDPTLLEVEDEEDGCRPLMLASSLGKVPMVNLLVKRGARVNEEDEDENTALHRAAGGGHMEVVDILLENGGDPMRRNVWNETPLMLAAEEGHEKVVARLLPLVGEGGLDVRDSDGHSALFGACLRGQVHTARMLLRAGASVGGENVEGNTIVQAVRRNGQRGSLALMQWWEGEHERNAMLHRVRHIYELTPTRGLPRVDVPAYLQARQVNNAPLPTVEVRKPCQGGAGAGKRGRKGGESEGEETTRAVAEYLVSGLSEDLFTELMQAMQPY